jgi:hypothetical protein
MKVHQFGTHPVPDRIDDSSRVFGSAEAVSTRGCRPGSRF